MRTTKPISTISFNTKGYLTLKLTELTKAKRISFWTFIEHIPEDDEGGNKTHYHVYIELSKMTQTDDLKEELKEFDPEKPDKPKGCISFRSSKFDDWYMYALHDKRYLASKGQARRFHYKHDDFTASNDDDLLFRARSIDKLSLSRYADMQDAIDTGLSFSEYFSRGTVPIQQVHQFQVAWGLLVEEHTFRNGRSGHQDTLYCDGDTGEVTQLEELDPEEDLPF